MAVEDIRDPITKEIIIKKNQEIDEEITQQIIEAGIDRVKIRSVLTCQSKYGVCTRCYGRGLGRGELVEKGESVGIMPRSLSGSQAPSLP